MGARAAHRYFLTAERFTAAEAHRIGLVHEVVHSGSWMPRCRDRQRAGAMPGRRPCGLQEAGAGRGRPRDHAGLVAMTRPASPTSAPAPEGREGVQSFLQKRKPNWLPETCRRHGFAGQPHRHAAAAGAGGGARLGQRLPPLCGGVPHRHRGLPGLDPLPEGLQVLQHPACWAPAASCVHRVLRRQDPLRRFDLGRGPHLHPHSGRRGAGGRRAGRRRPAMGWIAAILGGTPGGDQPRHQDDDAGGGEHLARAVLQLASRCWRTAGRLHAVAVGHPSPCSPSRWWSTASSAPSCCWSCW
jgi:hypothetical protein